MVDCCLFIDVDDTFMKTKFTGVLLTSIGVDTDNQILPIAFAYVEAENNSSWSWFLDLLHRTIGLKDNLIFTSDDHLGIINGLRVHFA